MFIIHTVIISFVGFMEAIAIARQLEQKEPTKDSKGVELYKYPTPVNSNQELFGQGLGNIASSFLAHIQYLVLFLDLQSMNLLDHIVQCHR